MLGLVPGLVELADVAVLVNQAGGDELSPGACRHARRFWHGCCDDRRAAVLHREHVDEGRRKSR